MWLGQTCNLRCHFCYFLDRIEDGEHPEHAFMSIEKAKALCKTLVDFYGNDAIDIQGGEPTIYRHIYELVAYCRQIGLQPTLITNALVLSDKKKVQRFKDAGIRDFLVSVQGLGLAHDMAVGVERAHERQMQAIGNLIELAVPFRFNVVMSNGAVAQLPFIARLAAHTGARVVNFLAFNPFADQRSSGVRTAQNVPRYEEVAPPLMQALDVLNAARIEANVRYLPFCTVDQKYWPHFYNHQQLSYDSHEWDFASWRWTMHASQVRSAVPLSVPSPLLVESVATGRVRRLFEALPKSYPFGSTAKRILGKLRRLRRVGQTAIGRLETREALYRREARRFKRVNQYRNDGCGACRLRDVCDGFHSDYAAIFGIREARPIVAGQRITCPTAFIREQSKLADGDAEQT